MLIRLNTKNGKLIFSGRKPKLEDVCSLWFVVKSCLTYQRKSAVSICVNLREKWDFEVVCSLWFVVKRFGIWPRCIGVEFG